jgi:transcriptional regulator with XRE-family HTH domain
MTSNAVRLRIATHVKRLRLQRGWSQEQLAERVGNTAKHISEIERGRANVGVDLLASIAGALGVDVAELFRNRAAGDATLTYTLTARDLERVQDALRILSRAKGSRARRAG